MGEWKLHAFFTMTAAEIQAPLHVSLPEARPSICSPGFAHAHNSGVLQWLSHRASTSAQLCTLHYMALRCVVHGIFVNLQSYSAKHEYSAVGCTARQRAAIGSSWCSWPFNVCGRDAYLSVHKAPACATTIRGAPAKRVPYVQICLVFLCKESHAGQPMGFFPRECCCSEIQTRLMWNAETASIVRADAGGGLRMHSRSCSWQRLDRQSPATGLQNVRCLLRNLRPVQPTRRPLPAIFPSAASNSQHPMLLARYAVPP